jgi:hypothetical protein
MLGLPMAWTQTAEEIIAKMVAADELQFEKLKHYEYRQTVVNEKLDEENKVIETNTIEMVIRPGDDRSFTIVAGEKGGVILPTADLSTMEKSAKESETFKANFSMRKMAPRFAVKVIGREMLNGREAFVLSFKPKPDQPFEDRIEKILNNLSGKIWVQTQDYGILKTQATLERSVELAWFFATMEKMDFYFESQPIEEGYGPKNFNLSYLVSLFLGEMRQSQRLTMRDFKKVTTAATAAP